MFEKFHKKTPQPQQADMPPLDIDDDDAPHRESHGAIWVTVLCVVLAVALILYSLPTTSASGTTVQTKLISGSLENKVLKTVLYGAGTLTPQDGEDVEVPQNIEISCRYVNNGDTVAPGDPILKVDEAQVKAAIAEVQELLDKIDDAITTQGNKSSSTSVTATTSGRVKKIFAQKDVAVADTMYENGALMLLSLDGTMAMDLPGELFTLGQTVTVRLSDGTELKGTVEGISDGVATVTCSDEKAEYGSIAEVIKDGNTLGSAQLYIHSMLRVAALQGTVTNVSVKEGRKVNNGTTLLTLKDVGKNAEYSRLLSRRSELEEHMEKLLKLSNDGILRADTDGIVTGLSDDVDYVSPDTLEIRAHSLASPGYTRVPGNLLNAQSPAEPGTSGGDKTPGEGGDSGEGGDTDEGGDSGGGGDSGEGGEEEEESVTYTVGVVVTSDGAGNITYIPTGSFTLPKGTSAEGMDFRSLATASTASPATPATISGTVKISDGSTWSDSGVESIASGDAILFGPGVVVHCPGGTLIDPAIPSMPGMDLSGLDLSGMAGMSGMASGLTAGTQQKQTPAYDSFGTTCTVAATVTPTQEMTVDITVDELDILSLQTGMEATITLDALPGKTYTGTVTRINPYGENSGGNTKYIVTVTLDRAEDMLTGMNASVKIETASSEEVPTVPAAAIQSKDGKSWLYTAYDEKTDTLSGLTEVTTGLSDGESVEILSGLPEGSTYYYRYADTIEYRFVG